MADLTYVLYDTAIFGTTAPAEHTLFQVAQGGDSTHTESFTNMRGAGALPSEEHLVVNHIEVFPDGDVAEADVSKIWTGNFLEVRVADKTLLKAPLALFAGHSYWSGQYTQATPTTRAFIGRVGWGFDLPNPVDIPGGTSFKVRVYQLNPTSGSINMKVCLCGVLSVP